jgi:hypothetical protein
VRLDEVEQELVDELLRFGVALDHDVPPVPSPRPRRRVLGQGVLEPPRREPGRRRLPGTRHGNEARPAAGALVAFPDADHDPQLLVAQRVPAAPVSHASVSGDATAGGVASGAARAFHADHGQMRVGAGNERRDRDAAAAGDEQAALHVKRLLVVPPGSLRPAGPAGSMPGSAPGSRPRRRRPPRSSGRPAPRAAVRAERRPEIAVAQKDPPVAPGGVPVGGRQQPRVRSRERARRGGVHRARRGGRLLRRLFRGARAAGGEQQQAEERDAPAPGSGGGGHAQGRSATNRSRSDFAVGGRLP